MDSAVTECLKDVSVEDIEKAIQELESRLAEAKLRLRSKNGDSSSENEVRRLGGFMSFRDPDSMFLTFLLARPLTSTSNHFLLLLSDSALPLGSFAFSSGLESYLAHTRGSSSFSTFLPISVSSYAATTLPFVLAAHRDPSSIADLDDYLDAAIICTVGRRASIAQGRALLGIWER